MEPGDSTVAGTAGFGRGAFGATVCGFFAAFAVVRPDLAAWVVFFRATRFTALPFVLFLAIDASS